MNRQLLKDSLGGVNSLVHWLCYRNNPLLYFTYIVDWLDYSADWFNNHYLAIIEES
jgi:hypothetical protein